MILFFITLIILLIAQIIYSVKLFNREKKDFNIKLITLKNRILEYSKIQTKQDCQIKLSQDLEKILKENKYKLNNDIFTLNYTLFEIASNNKLI